MNYKIKYSNELSHHGILGMKWGVWNDETTARYRGGSGNYNMTKRQAKKAIKNAKKKYRKETGKWFITGKNVEQVSKNKKKRIDNDKTLKELAQRQNEVADKSTELKEEFEELNSNRRMSKDFLQRVQEDPNSSRDLRREAEARYLKDKEALNEWNNNKDKGERLYKLEQEYDNLEDEYIKRYESIANSYLEKYKEAAVKDLGIEDIKLGVQMLEDYGLVNKALPWYVKYNLDVG